MRWRSSLPIDIEVTDRVSYLDQDPDGMAGARILVHRARGAKMEGQGRLHLRLALLYCNFCSFGWGVVTLVRRGRTAHAFVLVKGTSTRTADDG